MLMCIQILVKFCPLDLKILSGNEMVMELRNNGRTRQIQYSPTFQSGAIMMNHNPNLDLVNINMLTKSGQILSICSIHMEQK